MEMVALHGEVDETRVVPIARVAQRCVQRANVRSTAERPDARSRPQGDVNGALA